MTPAVESTNFDVSNHKYDDNTLISFFLIFFNAGQ